MLHRIKGRQRGFSLLEVLVALFILSIVGAAIFAGSLVIVKSTEVARTNIRAEGLAKIELEYVKSAARVSNNWKNGSTGIADQADGYSYTVPGSSYPAWEPLHITPFGSDTASEYAGYSVTIKINILPSPYDENIRKVTATVHYQPNPGASIATFTPVVTYIVNSP